MKNKNILPYRLIRSSILIFLSFFISLYFAKSFASLNHDWPQYNFDSMHTGFVPIDINIEGIRRGWEITFSNTYQTPFIAYPIISKDKVFI